MEKRVKKVKKLTQSNTKAEKLLFTKKQQAKCRDELEGIHIRRNCFDI